MFNTRKCYEFRQKKLFYRVINKNEMPKGPHLAIMGMYTESYIVPGDERSRTNPGHGYPEHTVTNNIIEYWVCENEQVWQEVIAEFYEQEAKRSYYSTKQEIIPMKVEGVATVQTKVVVEVK